MKSSGFWARPWTMPLVALLLFVATWASRVPFTSRHLYAWDPANFALGLEYYNVTWHQPHPPGYPLYVGIAKLISFWAADANTSFVIISIAASAGAVALLFLLAGRMYGPWTGLVAAILLGASVGFWGYGEIAYPYTSLAFLGTLVAWLCYLMWQGDGRVTVLSGLVLGMAGGVRQDLLLFLGPLWLVSIWRAGLPRVVLSGFVLVLAVAAWLYPAVQLSGGLQAFQQATDAQSDYIFSTYSAFFQGPGIIRNNISTLVLFIQQMYGPALLLMVYFLGRFLTFKGLVTDHRVGFLLLWFLPPLLVYTLIHIGDPGYVLSILPPLCIATAAGVADISRDVRSAVLSLSDHPRLAGIGPWASRAGVLVAMVLVLGVASWSVNSFLRAPGPARLTEIRTIDNILSNQLQYIRQFRPESVVVIGKDRYRQFQYYLRGYNLKLMYDEYRGDYGQVKQSFQIPEGVNTVLITDFGKRPAQFPGATGEEIVLSQGPLGKVSVWQFKVQPGDTIEYGFDYFGVKARN